MVFTQYQLLPYIQLLHLRQRKFLTYLEAVVRIIHDWNSLIDELKSFLYYGVSTGNFNGIFLTMILSSHYGELTRKISIEITSIFTA